MNYFQGEGLFRIVLNDLVRILSTNQIKIQNMIKKNILEIKRLVSDLHCMGTYGMVELELTKIENYIKELEGRVIKDVDCPKCKSKYVYYWLKDKTFECDDCNEQWH